ncbi:MAG: right-handed parallel beta-helix repeat-containing protein [Thermoplasmatota archaeon]|nr:right-handed parallel beta-helix repeat-containing protein [Candidatus Thermoplasmatota archaeon]
MEIKNLTISNGAPGLYTKAVEITAPETKISNCKIYNTPIGIALWTSYNLIENCIFTGCLDEAIALLGSQYSKCDYNKITYCEFYNNCDGIELQNSSNNIISNCKFYNNSHIGINAIKSSNNKNIILNCEIHNNTVGGIYLSSSSNNHIIDCFISSNGDENITITKNSYNNNVINSKSSSLFKENNLKKRIFERLSYTRILVHIFTNFLKKV